MSGNAPRDINQTIADILNSPVGADHYGGRRNRKSWPFEGSSKRDRRWAARKGSWNEAYRLHARLLFRLRKYGWNEQEAELLRLLWSCRPSRRCTSPACPKCTYAVQGVMSTLVRDLLSHGIRFDACLTIVPLLLILHGDDVSGYVEIGKRKWQRFRENLDETFGEKGIIAIGCIDVDSSELPGGEYEEHSKPQVHALVFRNQYKAGKKVVRRDFINKGSVHKAVDTRMYNGSDKWTRYEFKYPNNRKIRKKDEHGKWLESAYKPLTVQQQLQQALLLHEVGWGSRLFLNGVKLAHDAGKWRLVLTDLMPQVRKSV